MRWLSWQASKTEARHSTTWWVTLSVAVTALGAGLRLYHLGFHGLWYDEAFTAWTAAQSPRSILWISLQDVVHPPLYYLLISLVTRLIGNSESGLRALSAAASLLGVPLIILLGRRVWGRRVGLAAGLLWACLPFPIWYAQEARMYALLTVVGLAASLCLAQSLPGGSSRWLMANAILNLGGLYTHYFYLFPLMAQYVYLAITLRRHRLAFWRWFAMNALSALLYVPWVVQLVRRGLSDAEIAWIKPLSLRTLGQAMWELAAGPLQPLSVPAALSASVMVLGLLAAATAHRLKHRSTNAGLIWVQLLWPLATVALISIRTPVFHARLLQIVLPFGYLLVAAGLVRSFRLWMSGALLASIVLGAAPTLQGMYAANTRYGQDWKGAMQYLEAHTRAGDSVAFRGGQGWHAFWYYYDGPPVYEISLQPEDGIEALNAQAGTSRQLWLFVWDVYRSCKVPAEFIPQPGDSLRIVGTPCFPEILFVSYSGRGQGP